MLLFQLFMKKTVTFPKSDKLTVAKASRDKFMNFPEEIVSHDWDLIIMNVIILL